MGRSSILLLPSTNTPAKNQNHPPPNQIKTIDLPWLTAVRFVGISRRVVWWLAGAGLHTQHFENFFLAAQQYHMKKILYHACVRCVVFKCVCVAVPPILGGVTLVTPLSRGTAVGYTHILTGVAHRNEEGSQDRSVCVFSLSFHCLVYIYISYKYLPTHEKYS